VVLSVVLGEHREAVQTFARERGLTFPILLDEDGAAARLYAVHAIPASFIIDPQGVICSRHIGPLAEPLLARYWSECRG
jgi:peroxiredoxin